MDYHYDWPSDEQAEEQEKRTKKHDELVLSLTREIMEQKLKTHGGRLDRKRLQGFVTQQLKSILYPSAYYTNDGDPVAIELLSRTRYFYDGKDVVLCSK